MSWAQSHKIASSFSCCVSTGKARKSNLLANVPCLGFRVQGLGRDHSAARGAPQARAAAWGACGGGGARIDGVGPVHDAALLVRDGAEAALVLLLEAVGEGQLRAGVQGGEVGRGPRTAAARCRKKGGAGEKGGGGRAQAQRRRQRASGFHALSPPTLDGGSRMYQQSCSQIIASNVWATESVVAGPRRAHRRLRKKNNGP